MLTSVTQTAPVPAIAPLPAVHNRLSIMDFQRIQASVDNRVDNAVHGK